MRRCRCGNEVAREAKFCANCGNRLATGAGRFLLWLGIVLILAIVSSILSLQLRLSPAQQAAERAAAERSETQAKAQEIAQKKEQAEIDFAALGARTLHSAMRNPDSFTLTQVLIMKNGSVCYEYRAQNGFGGMNVDKAVLTSLGKLVTTEQSGSSAILNKECYDKVGRDATSDVGIWAGVKYDTN